jgi:hypothetical protein
MALLLIALLFIAVGTQAHAQNAPTLNPAQVPAEGAREQDFVPRGFKIEGRVEGDLNGDRRPDRVIQLATEDYDSSGITAAPETHALLILLSDDRGRLRRAGLATRLLVPTVPQYGLQLTIRNGVLVVNQNFGMTDVTDLTHRFRYEPGSRRFLLIGKDTFSYHRPQGPRWPATRVSDNYLTGVRLTTTDRWINEETNRPTTRRERIARTRLFLEDVNENTDN